MGSETVTYKDLQIQPLMEKPEEAYRQYMLEAFKQIRYGMRHVNAHYQTGIIDTRSLFNDGFLRALGYDPSEKIAYTILDPALALSWIRSNISPAVENNVSASWRAPTLEELAIEYLQDTYSGMVLAEKSFLIDNVRWYISGVTSTSFTATDATCYKNKYDTVTKSISPSNIVYIENQMVVYEGVNCWVVKVTTSAELKYIPVEYTTIQCPGVTDAVVQTVIDTYNNSIQEVSYESEPDPETGWITTWDASVRMSVFIDNSGELIVTGVTESHTGGGGGWSSYEIKQAAKAMAIAIVRPLVEQAVGEKLERLVAYYTLYGELKIVIAEVKKSLVTTTANAKAYPIIPLKQNFKFVKENTGMKVVLNKLGLSRKDFKDSLADSRINNAALMFMLELNDTKEYSVKAIYETLTNMVKTAASGTGKYAAPERFQLNLKFAQVGYTSVVAFTLHVISGSIGPVGKYTTSTRAVQIPIDSSGEVTTGGNYIRYKVIRKQITEAYYEELVLDPRNSGTVWRVAGYELGGGKRRDYDDYTFEGVYIPITDIGLKPLNYKELHNVIARSMSMMVLSVVTVKSKWYQTMFFQAIMFAVIIVITVLTGGIAMGMLAFLGLAGVDLGVFGQILTVVMAIYTMGASLAASGFTLTTGTLLTSAQTLTSLAVVASDISTKGAMKALEDKAKETQAALNESEKLIEEIDENTSPGLWMGIDDRLPDMLYLMSSTDAMCNYDLLYDYDSVIGSQIRSVGV